MAQQRIPGGKMGVRGAGRSEGVALRAGRAAADVCSVLARVAIPLVLLGGLALGALYVRLLNGPISLKPLAEPLARGIAAELAIYDVTVEDAILRMTPTGGLEFRLRNVRLLESDGQPVAVAPLAAVTISHTALWSGRIAPERIVLIEPRLLVLVGDSPGRAAVTDRPAPSTAPASDQAASAAGREAARGEVADEPLRRIDLARMFTDATSNARRSGDAGSHLKKIGLKQGTLIIDHAGRPTVWRVLDADIDLEHRKRRSYVTAEVTMASATGPWQISVQTADSDKEQSLSVSIGVRDLVPAALAGSLPDNSPLRSIDAPVSAQLRARLGLDGKLLSADAIVELKADLNANSTRTAPRLSPVDRGRLDLSIDPKTFAVSLNPSILESAGSWVKFAGRIDPPVAAGARGWTVALRGIEGTLAAGDAAGRAHPIEKFILDAVADPISGQIDVRQAMLKAGGTEVSVAGRLAAADDKAGSQLEYKFSPMPLAIAKALWPVTLAPVARDWVSKHVGRGRIAAGTLRYEQKGVEGAAGSRPGRFALAVEATDVEVSPILTLPAIEAPRALIRLEGDALEVAVPDATTGVSPQRRLALKAARFLINDIVAEHPVGELSFRAQGTLVSALGVLEREPISVGRTLGGQLDGVDGKVDGQFRFLIPLERDVLFRDIRMDGKARISEGRGKGIAGGFDVQGAAINVDLTSEAIEAKGDLLLGGVNAKISLQHIFDAASDKQPPLRLSATLDAADRNQLGIDINHFVTGEIPVEITLARGQRGDAMPRLRADLTNAELMIEPLGWSKPPGRAATLQCDLGKSPKYKTELQNFKLVGDDIAIDGWLGIDQQNRLREFYFPEFSVNVVSRLELQGQLRGDNIWDIRAKGPTLDGRDFFRSMFSVGRSSGKQPAPRPGKDATGIDIKAEVDTVLGFSELSLKGVKLQVSKRSDKLAGLSLRGLVEGGKLLEVGLQQATNEPRRLVATTDDAGQAFRLIGFYPNMQSGRMRLVVNLDGRGPAEKTGQLEVVGFQLLGDPVISEVLQANHDQPGVASGATKSKSRVVRQAIDFDSFVAPFEVGYGQFVLSGADLRGPLFGASIKGKADFRSKTLNLAGTYAPLQGVNAAIGVIPGIGQILTGPRGEGVLGINFSVQGSMAQPQVTFNPLSLLAPGVFRDITQLSNPSTQVVPTAEKPAPKQPFPAARASSQAATDKKRAGPGVQPELSGGWSLETTQQPASKGPVIAPPPSPKAPAARTQAPPKTGDSGATQ